MWTVVCFWLYKPNKVRCFYKAGPQISWSLFLSFLYGVSYFKNNIKNYMLYKQCKRNDIVYHMHNLIIINSLLVIVEGSKRKKDRKWNKKFLKKLFTLVVKINNDTLRTTSVDIMVHCSSVILKKRKRLNWRGSIFLSFPIWYFSLPDNIHNTTIFKHCSNDFQVENRNKWW